MRMRFPRPLKGWRVFAGEVATIVLGVLLALGAQEVVQGLHWRSEVKQTRSALDAELARDLGAFNQRYDNRQCIADRVAEIRRWSDSLAAGTLLPLKGTIEEPPYFAVRTAAWEVTDGEIASRIPVQAKLNYAGLYDSFRKYDQIKDDESNAWATLNEYGSARRLDAADQRAIHRALKDIEDVNAALELFKIAFARFSRELGIRAPRAIEGSANPMMQQWEKEACTPLL